MKTTKACVLFAAVAAMLLTNSRVFADETPSRETVLEWFRQNQFGVAPIGKPTDEELGTDFISCAGGAVKIPLYVRIPESASAEHPAPVFVMGELKSDNSISATVPEEELLKRGYAYIRYNFNSVAPNADPGVAESVWHQGVFDVYGPATRSANSWGTIAAWSWGFSRVVDWIEANPKLDATRIAVVSHSRGGKTALWAGAQDARIALAISSCSGCCGAQQLRLKVAGSEKLADILDSTKYHYWFAPNLAQWIGKEETLPYDGADLIGLMKGRLAYVSSGSTDVWAGPTAETAAVELARAAGTTVGRHIHDGGHAITTEDWMYYLDFADENLKAKNEETEPEEEGVTVPPTHEAEMTVAGYQGGALQDFPVLVRISSTAIVGFNYGDCLADGGDIQFLQDGVQCPYEIEKWDPTGESLVWVRLATLVKGGNFLFQYGGSRVQNDPTEVWKDAYEGVWHMSEPGGRIADATGNGHAAVPTGTEQGALSVSGVGRIGAGRKNGSGDGISGSNSSYLSLLNTANLEPNGKLTASGWVKIAGDGISWPRFMSNKIAGTDLDGFEIHGSKSAPCYWVMRGCSDKMLNPVANPWFAGMWAHYVFVYDGNAYSAYTNGALVASGTYSGGTVLKSANSMSIGSNSNGSEWALYGTLDEFRLRLGAASSADWASAEYACVQDGFIVAGEARGVDGGDSVIEATLTGIEVFEDGDTHGPTLTVTDPAEGYVVKWSVDGGAFGPDVPTFVSAGTHAVACRIAAVGYRTKVLSTTVVIKLREIQATASDCQCVLDGEPHGCIVTVTDPDEGYRLEWSADGETFSPTAPILGKGTTRVYCRISKEHYRTKVVSADVHVVRSPKTAGIESEMTIVGYEGAALEDFPVLVRISESAISGFSYAACESDGSDLVFVQGGLVCPYEIDTWDPEGESLVWVRLAHVAKGATFAMRYGGQDVRNDPAATWKGGTGSYAGVWHMSEADGDVADATGNGLAASPKGAQKSALSVRTGGIVGSGRRNGSADYKKGADTSYLSIQNSAVLPLNGRFAVSGWVKRAGGGDYWPRIISNKMGTEDVNGFEIHGSEASGFWTMRGQASNKMSNIANPWQKDVWLHMVFVYDGETYSAYMNGELAKKETISGGEVQDCLNAIAIGSNPDGSQYALYGAMDEFRLRRGAVSADWAAAEYETVNNAGFLEAGAVRKSSGGMIIQATLADVNEFADGAAYGPQLSVTEPSSGATAEWAVDGGSFSPKRPTFTEVGAYQVTCRVSADGYMTAVLKANVILRDVVYVSNDGSDTPPYNTPETAARSLKNAISVAGSSSKVIILPGRYEIEPVTIPAGVRVCGPADRSAVFSGSVDSRPSAGLIKLEKGSELSGCTFMKSWTPVSSVASSIISNCLFRQCVEPVSLGGLFTHSDIIEFGGADREPAKAGLFAVEIGTPYTRISHCMISNGWNRAVDFDDKGGTIFVPGHYETGESRPLTIEDTDILYTTNIINYGSAIYSVPSSPAKLTRCRFVGNVARVPCVRLSNQGNRRNRLVAENCLFADNASIILKSYWPSASDQKMVSFFCYGELTNCTLVNNDNEGAPFFSVNNESDGTIKMTIRNCILQGNKCATWEDVANGKDGSMRDIAYSLFPGATGTGNIVGPAKFVGRGIDPYRLELDSPGVNAGTKLDWKKSDVDLLGRRRISNGQVDMGCYEAGGGFAIFFF